MSEGPPPRPAHLFQTHNGLSRDAAQVGLLFRLSLSAPCQFEGDAVGFTDAAAEDADGRIRCAFTSGKAAGELVLSMEADGWLKAEVFIGGRQVFRAWIEDPYEEKEGWPDGADGVGEGPLRISKRGSWLSIDCSRFPGVPVGEHGYFQLRLIDS